MRAWTVLLMGLALSVLLGPRASSQVDKLKPSDEDWVLTGEARIDAAEGETVVYLSSGRALRPDEEPSVLVEKAKRFRSLIADEKWDEARAMMAPDPRRWFAPREGEGSPWIVGPRSGPWAEWDEEFRSTSTVIGWRADDSSATVRVREINDYFRLLERGAVTNEITYFFDSEGRIDGLLIDAAGERPPGRTDEFLQWALENEPVELRELMPDGEIDPSGDHPRRFRALLEQWRRSRN